MSLDRDRVEGPERGDRPAEAPQDAGAVVSPSGSLVGAPARRDPRVDVLRGFALLTIFVDHIPNNAPALFTLHNFGFSDAAEIFVLLAGYSSMIAYGRLFERDGTLVAMRRIGLRCLRIYLYQAGLLLTTLLIVRLWMVLTGLVPRFGVAALLQMGLIPGAIRGLLLNALPNYLDILPLYILLLALFPIVYLGMRRHFRLVLAVSAAVWLVANLDSHLNLPNAAAVDDGWYFNPFAWQFLFTIGCAMALAVRAGGGFLPGHLWLVVLCWGYLAFALMQAAPWTEWGLPDLRPLPVVTPPDKGRVPPLRLVNILALMTVLFSARWVLAVSRHRWLRPLEMCGKHSLEVFAAGCLAALSGRLLYRTFGNGWPLQTAVNVTGILVMIALAVHLERRARRG